MMDNNQAAADGTIGRRSFVKAMSAAGVGVALTGLDGCASVTKTALKILLRGPVHRTECDLVAE
ncbi:MAG: twin-arginine translocation signal domain-containing protein [Planctomycetota bacterium]|nr:twin-arginine translocation signal domain-containing protein [Planctomycetota bacterium]